MVNLSEVYLRQRDTTKELCTPLEVEDYVIQSHADVSPPKWHLAHTSWFFETFLLIPYLKNYQTFNAVYHHLFNSYYQSMGDPYPRVKRGLLSRPTVADIYQYRAYVDSQIVELMQNASAEIRPQLNTLLTLGLHHEQQHQELLLMDIKHNFSLQADFPSYQPQGENDHPEKESLRNQFIAVESCTTNIGFLGEEFCFDNELPQHPHILKSYAIAKRLVTNREYLEFINAGGYQRPEFWLSDGWSFIQENQYRAPLYWYLIDHNWFIFTLSGLKKINLNEPVVHVSYYEADAFARFCDARLPTEMEWEHFVVQQNVAKVGNFLESKRFHPVEINEGDTTAQQFFGDVWEWTSSAYSPYPGFKSLCGALSEYNGKFMSNQFVLRGGCCITPASHIRATYRNFFQPDKRWQFSGIRLATD